MDSALSLTEYSGTLKPKTSLGISAFARTIERKAHGYLGAAPAAIGLSLSGEDSVAFYVPLLEYPQRSKSQQAESSAHKSAQTCIEALRGLKYLPKVARDDSLSWADPHQRNPVRHPQRARDVKRAVRIPHAVKYSSLYLSRLYELLSEGRIGSICVKSQNGPSAEFASLTASPSICSKRHHDTIS